MYDFIEFVANNYRKYKFRDAFISSCNAILEKRSQHIVSLMG